MYPSNLDRFPLPPDNEPTDGLDLTTLYAQADAPTDDDASDTPPADFHDIPF